MRRILIILFIFINVGCTKSQHQWGDVCEGTSSCPELGHGTCPFCFDENYLD
jgi:hypothetical protein